MDNLTEPELPNLVTILENKLKGTPFASHLALWENIIFSLIVFFIILTLSYFASRKTKLIPDRLQNLFEVLVEALNDFICGILGPAGRKYTPFVGTLFLYIIFMNFFGLIPFMKSPTTSWSVTLALALCVFIYVQYTAFSKLGFFGYFYQLMEKPKGMMAYSLIYPAMMLLINLISRLLQPITLSLRLRSNVWGDDMLLAVLAGFGLKGVPLLLFSTFLAIIAGIVQAVVFCLLTTIYFALILVDEGEDELRGHNT